ncbi:MAG: tRNA pseudouridine synthase A [Deltaproteobacteria bacterium]|nr:tRNA pseudouridine synthase A [Deltaproteobacteria bacterium]
MKRHTYRARIAYDGTAFASFAHVPGELTVWSALRSALVSLGGGFGHLAAGGRTDRGVSATGQVISFIYRDFVPPDEICGAIDSVAPGALVALEVRKVSDSFHAQFSACARRYVYFAPDADALDVERLDRLLNELVGERRSFTAFARDTPPGKKLDRALTEARARRVSTDEGPRIRFDFAAQGFLRKQLRVLVATALREARTPSDDEALLRIAESGDRRATAQPADSRGLVLVKVSYDPVSPKPGHWG